MKACKNIKRHKPHIHGTFRASSSLLLLLSLVLRQEEKGKKKGEREKKTQKSASQMGAGSSRADAPPRRRAAARGLGLGLAGCFGGGSSGAATGGGGGGGATAASSSRAHEVSAELGYRRVSPFGHAWISLCGGGGGSGWICGSGTYRVWDSGVVVISWHIFWFGKITVTVNRKVDKLLEVLVPIFFELLCLFNDDRYGFD